MIDLVSKIREMKPVVHCITNGVTINDCANVLVAVGASPIMAHHIKEVAEVTSHGDAFVCNLGATDNYDSIEASVQAANEKGIPVVLDPVGIATSSYRRAFARDLIEKYHIDCVRGNYSEMVALILDCETSSGLDNKLSIDDVSFEELQSYCRKQKGFIFMSGVKDYVISAEGAVEVESGVREMTTFSGSGCMLSVLLGAALAVENSSEALIAMGELYGDSGKAAALKKEEMKAGAMTFKHLLMDEISLR